MPKPLVYIYISTVTIFQGTQCTGKTGITWKMAKKNPCQKKTQGIWNFAKTTGKTQGIWFAQVVNPLILNVKDIAKFATKSSQKNLPLDKSVKFCVCN